MASVWEELKRRNVVKVAVAYAIVGWLVIEIAATTFPILQLPDWTVTFITMLIALGFPIAIILSWAFELTPDGMAPTKAVPLSESITPATGQKLNYAIIGLLVVALVYVVVDNYVLSDADDSEQAVVADDQPSIAVLPFDNRSAQEEDQYFVDGMHDDILPQLARIGSLRVISRTSVMAYRDTEMNMRDIGEELGVTTILEGGVQRAGDTGRINVQLIDTVTDEHLWAETYDRELTAENVFAIQSAMATSIADALQAALTPEDVNRLNDVPTQNTRALDFYLSGNNYYRQSDDETFTPLAVGLYEQAVAEDPNFALAWAALSLAHSNMHWRGVDMTPARLELAESAARRALEISPQLPEAHMALASYYDHGFRDYERAQREYDIARQIVADDPRLIEAMSYMRRRMGDWVGAAAALEQLLERDPRNDDLLFQVGITHLQLRNYTEAENYLDSALEIAPDNAAAYSARTGVPLYRDGDTSLLHEAADNPAAPTGSLSVYNGWLAAIFDRDYDTALARLGRWTGDLYADQVLYYPRSLLYGISYQLSGREDLAAPEFQESLSIIETALAAGAEDPRLHIAQAQALLGLGEVQAAEASARRAMEIMPRSRDDLTGSFVQEIAIYGVFAPSGNVDAVVEELDSLMAAPSSWSIEGLLPDPRFDPVRDDPRFQALVEKYRRQ
jgi:TolB-like protein/Flp pilus assembly protein TadD